MNIQAINKLPWPENLLRRLLMDEYYDEWRLTFPLTLMNLLLMFWRRPCRARNAYPVLIFLWSPMPT